MLMARVEVNGNGSYAPAEEEVITYPIQVDGKRVEVTVAGDRAIVIMGDTLAYEAVKKSLEARDYKPTVIEYHHTF